MFDTHIDENAELYALGALDEMERTRVERHVHACDLCAKRLGEAEATVLHLIEGRETRRQATRSPVPIAAAVAAAFLIGLLPWGITSLGERAAVESAHQQQLAMRAMIAGHFVHAPFVARVPGAPPAKVIYARDGGWLYVIVAPGSHPLDVVVFAGGRHTKVASLAASTAARSAFVNEPTRVEFVELRDRGAPVAVAHIVYAAAKER